MGIDRLSVIDKSHDVVSFLLPPVMSITEDTHPKVRKQYSKDLKERVIYQRNTLGLSTTEIAKSLAMHPRVVRRTLQLWNELGTVVRDPRTYAMQGRPRLLGSDCVEVCTHNPYLIIFSSLFLAQFVLGLLERHPDIYLDELAERLMEQKNMEVSLATIHRSLKLLGITSKKVSIQHCSEITIDMLLTPFSFQNQPWNDVRI